jgi:predicted DCC family thiol-disulfide oxidoreductase YuxK
MSVKGVVTESASPDRALEAEHDPVLLYDGLCGMCNGAVRLILRLESRPAIRFAPLNGPYATSALARVPELATEDTIVLMTRSADGRKVVRVRSDAALAVLGHLRGGRLPAKVLSLVPRSLRDAVYRVIARHRTKVMGRYDACPIPPPEVRSRFIP